MSMVNASRGNNPSRNQPRSTTPFNNGPAVASSGIPRPVLDAQQQPNESSASLSASRQKQSKRDEVREGVHHNKLRSSQVESCFEGRGEES